ncbi:hypothetical protein QCA50_012291 [Cerrena zonata]|uniref:Uncharacterized protein n=1 Tax=Cerrena zonata TaxID=2478898 RepID=A0AAW0G429_9APHY
MAITLDQNNQFTLSDLPPKVISAPLQDTFIKTTNRLKDKPSGDAYPKTLAPPVSAESGFMTFTQMKEEMMPYLIQMKLNRLRKKYYWKS